LGNGDARALLGFAIPFVLDAQVRDRILAETRGNPLALLELPSGLTGTQLAGGFGLLHAQSLSGGIEESFARRFEMLDDDARLLLLLAAAEPVGDPQLLLRASERIGIATTAADDAEAQGLVAIGRRVKFRHPLVRSAIYRSATAEDRRAVHHALAEATDPNADPDRRAWHRAAAAERPDAQIALELERSAGRAQARAGLAAAAAFLDRAAALTPDPVRRPRRALAAAQAKFQAGAPEASLALLAVAEVGPLDELERAQAELVRAQIASSQKRGSDAPLLLIRAAKRLEPLDAALSRATYRDAFNAATWADSSDEGAGVLDVAKAVLATPSPERPRPADLLIEGAAMQCTKGFAAGVPQLKRALTSLRSGEISDEEQLEWSVLIYRTAVDLWDDESWYVMATRCVDLARGSGALPVLHFALNARVVADAFMGDLAGGLLRMGELKTVCEVIASELPPYSPMALAAWRGLEAEGSELITATTEQALTRGETLALSAADWAAAVLYNGLGRYEQALTAAGRAVDYQHLGFSGWSLAELIEAGARRGELERAADALEQLTARARDCGSDWALGIEARSRALLTEGEAADRLYREALDRLNRTRVRTEHARAHLLYGEWLRRERRRLEAREQLRTAYEMFTAMGVRAFAERAERELLATGERVRRRVVETRDELTAQEGQIARLARDGLSNPEIGARLFISPRTVEYHLHKIFAKLDISSRLELSRAIPSDLDATAAV
jgi:DNA-binding CsgD family transcriptional regulator